LKLLSSNKNLIDKVQAWVAKNYDPTPNVNMHLKEKKEEDKDQKVSRTETKLINRVWCCKYLRIQVNDNFEEVPKHCRY
jgi:hypothetical protein